MKVGYRFKSSRNPIFQEQLLFSGEFFKVRYVIQGYQTGASVTTEIKIKRKNRFRAASCHMIVKGRSYEIKIGNKMYRRTSYGPGPYF